MQPSSSSSSKDTPPIGAKGHALATGGIPIQAPNAEAAGVREFLYAPCRKFAGRQSDRHHRMRRLANEWHISILE
jgi:hypothetical protein